METKKSLILYERAKQRGPAYKFGEKTGERGGIDHQGGWMKKS